MEGKKQTKNNNKKKRKNINNNAHWADESLVDESQQRT